MGDTESICKINRKGLRYLYANAQGVGNKQRYGEILEHEGWYNIAAFTET